VLPDVFRQIRKATAKLSWKTAQAGVKVETENFIYNIDEREMAEGHTTIGLQCLCPSLPHPAPPLRHVAQKTGGWVRLNFDYRRFNLTSRNFMQAYRLPLGHSPVSVTARDASHVVGVLSHDEISQLH
jgi:hypothetical protein